MKRKSFTCVCKVTPNGAEGLNGFRSANEYQAEHVLVEATGKEYYRLYHVGRSKYGVFCSKQAFDSYFSTKKIVA